MQKYLGDKKTSFLETKRKLLTEYLVPCLSAHIISPTTEIKDTSPGN